MNATQEALRSALHRALARRGPDDQWLDRCPLCAGPLFVVSYTLCATGERVEARAELSAEGFLVRTRSEDASTEEEVVSCGSCLFRAALSDLDLDSV